MGWVEDGRMEKRDVHLGLMTRVGNRDVILSQSSSSSMEILAVEKREFICCIDLFHPLLLPFCFLQCLALSVLLSRQLSCELCVFVLAKG